MPSDTPTAFFSYSREDLEFALRLAKDLKKAGANVWMDKLDIRPGQHWERKVEEALGSCPRVLVILSPSSVNSANVMAEVSFALEEGKEVVPVLYRECKIPFRLRPVQYVDFRNTYAEAFDELLGSMGVEIALAVPAVSAVVTASEEASDRPNQAQIAPNRVAWLHQQAEAGDVQAMAELGCIYGKGKEVERDREQQFFWYGKAAEAGNLDGMFNLALLYIDADAEKDEKQAVFWYRKAAEAGHRFGMYKLAYMYERGKGVERDYKEAMKWYAKANELEVSGAADALDRVTHLQKQQDEAAAQKSRPEQEERERQAAIQRASPEREKSNLEAAGSAGSEEARNALQSAAARARGDYTRVEIGSSPEGSFVYSKFSPAFVKGAIAAGILVVAFLIYLAVRPKPQSKENLVSANSAETISEPTSPQAMNERGDDYSYGRSGLQKNYEQAVAWYRKAAEAGNANGMRNLGYMYYYGLGLAVDNQKAVYWYLRSAEAGNALGMAFLGDMYKTGTGVDKDPKQALGWFRKAAEANEPYAMNDLGEMYENGSGIKADREQAINWYRKAAKLGNQDAVANLKRLNVTLE